ncbi:MAG: hypothetical protein AAGC43_07495 [Bacteroidota bacterium]
MQKIITFLHILLLSNLVSGQHTERFEKIVSGKLPSRTQQVNKKFKNGQQKELGKIAVYEHNGYEYSFYVGKWTNYYKSGQVMTDVDYDNFGNPILWKLYDGKGNLLRESKVVKIDSNSKDFEQFLEDKNSTDILTEEKKYKYTFKACKWFLASKGQMRNYKKIGEWTKYYDEGRIKKVVQY